MQDVSIVLWVAGSAAILLLMFLGAFWWGTRPSLWDRPASREGSPGEDR